jgi:hypothetical protein
MSQLAEKALQSAMSVYAPEYWHYGVIESSDLPGSNVGISLGDLMDEYGIPADKITYGPN